MEKEKSELSDFSDSDEDDYLSGEKKNQKQQMLVRVIF
jgi:hypothetical protein